jgi:hypothetical protein
MIAMHIVSHFVAAPWVCMPAYLIGWAFAAHSSGCLTQSHMQASATFFGDSEFNGTTLLIVIVVVIVLLVVGALSAKKRREGLQKVSVRMGYTFDRNGDNFSLELNQQLHLLQLGSSNKVYNVLRGSGPSGEIVLFEFEYSEKGAYNAQMGTQIETKHYQTVAAFKLPGANIPYFHLASKHWWHKAAKVFGFQTITFETHPQFGERYLLRGSNEGDIRKFFRPSLLEYLQSLPEKPGWSVEAAPPWLVVYHAGKRPKPEEIPSFRDAALNIASNVMAGVEMRRAAQAG